MTGQYRCTSRPMPGTRRTMGSIWRPGTGCAPCCSIRTSSTSPTASCARRRTCDGNLYRGRACWRCALGGDPAQARGPGQKAFDVIECAVGPYHPREGFIVYWCRSSQKKKRDTRDREERIERTIERPESLNLRRMRGPKTDAAIRMRVDEVIAQHGAEEWVTVEIKWDAVEKFKAITRGKPTADTIFRRIIQQVPRLHVGTDAANIARSAAMDGTFPLTTNTKEKPVEVFKIYKYQPRIEKRHALLKSTLEVAPIWLKKNARIEALMFLEFLGQMVAALIERELRQKMVENNIDLLCSLPEGRPSKTPTIDQVLRLLRIKTSTRSTRAIA